MSYTDTSFMEQGRISPMYDFAQMKKQIFPKDLSDV